ncbi:hypothetical protein [Sphingobium tyrosinilyticum]|uniref:TauD/TfdA-like domain-containing protein n=1 Tax=Sphingobium tyrosinilyticum TaxID=2715436 RepID=A0ABV9F4H2_9SPHN
MNTLVPADAANQLKDHGWRVRRTSLPAEATHPATGKTLFFNTIHATRKQRVAVGEEKIALIGAACSNYPDKPSAAAFRKGDPLSEEDFLDTHAERKRREVAFPWTLRDVILLDDKLPAHGRLPYKGERDTRQMLFK